MTHAISKRLLIECPVGVEAPDTPTEMIETYNGVRCFVVRGDRAFYAPIKTYSGGPGRINRTLGRQVAQIRAYTFEFELKIPDERFFIYRTLARISRHFSGLREKSLIRVFDFLLPEDSDVEAAILAQQEACTLRQVVMVELKPGGGIVGQEGNPGGWMSQGCTVRFEDLEMRLD